MNDWCRKTAAQIMVAAYADPNAREHIEDLLKLTFMQGELRAVEEAQRIVRQAFAERSL